MGRRVLTMTTLRMKGVRCASLEEFRENFDFTNARDYLREGRLSQWGRDLGKSELADKLDKIKDDELSDQTLLDNFIGIFGLKRENVRLPLDAKFASGMPAVLVSEIENAEECAYADSEICFRDSRGDLAEIVSGNLPAVREGTSLPSLTMRNVERNSASALAQYANNKTVLKLIRELVLNDLPEGLYEKYGYRYEITADSRFVEDLGLDTGRLCLLADWLNEKFDVGDNRFVGASRGISLVSSEAVAKAMTPPPPPPWIIMKDAWCVERAARIIALMGVKERLMAKTVGKLLDNIKSNSLRLKSYSDDMVNQLGEDGF